MLKKWRSIICRISKTEVLCDLQGLDKALVAWEAMAKASAITLSLVPPAVHLLLLQIPQHCLNWGLKPIIHSNGGDEKRDRFGFEYHTLHAGSSCIYSLSLPLRKWDFGQLKVSFSSKQVWRHTTVAQYLGRGGKRARSLWPAWFTPV